MTVSDRAGYRFCLPIGGSTRTRRNRSSTSAAPTPPWSSRISTRCTPWTSTSAIFRSEVSGDDIRLANPFICEEAISRFRIGPVLARQRNTGSHRAIHLLDEPAQPYSQALVPECTVGELAIKPCLRPNDAPPKQVNANPPWHQVIVHPGEDRDALIAALIDSGGAKEGDNFMAFIIVEPIG